MAIPKPQREYSEPPRGRPWILVLIAIVLVAAVYWQIRSAPEEAKSFVFCNTASECAVDMAKSWQARLPIERDTDVVESVTANGETVVMVRRLKYDRTYYESSQIPDGKNWEQFEADFAAVACDEYDHRPLVELGGRVIHRTLFSDGELLSELVIDSCALSP